MRHLALIVLLNIATIPLVQATAVFEPSTDPITKCWDEVNLDFSLYDEADEDRYFKKDECTNAESKALSRNFYAAYAQDELKDINTVFLTKVDEIWKDNQGGAFSLAKNSGEALRTYNYCLQSLCDLIRRDCAEFNANSNDQQNYDQCLTDLQQLNRFGQVSIEAAATENINRKTHSLVVEGLSALSFRFDEFLHPRLNAVNKYLATAEKSILALAKLLR